MRDDRARSPGAQPSSILITTHLEVPMSRSSSASSQQPAMQNERRRFSWRAGAIAVASLIPLIACDNSPLPPEPPQAQSQRADGVVASASTLAGTSAATSASRASINALPASAQCPPQYFITGINLAKNPSFELGTGPQTWPPGPTPPPSAAKGWYMHTNNSNATVSSARVATNVPGPGGTLMLSFHAGGAEGGVYQLIPSAPSKVMFSVWVKVFSGIVTIGANGTTGMTPYSSSTKKNEWEQLRVCTDGTYPTGDFFIFNEAPNGGSFVADRVEIKEIP
jgi:hypothetical protein